MYQYVVAHTFYEQNILDGHLLEQFVCLYEEVRLGSGFLLFL